MTRIAGVILLLVVLYGLLFWADPKNATKWSNVKDVASQQAFFGVITLGVGVLMITGGIDLSIGSVVGFSAVLFGVLLRNGVMPYLAVGIVLVAGTGVGALHAGLITRLKLQPFLVTLCGLFVYRGAARMLSPGQPVGLQTILASTEKAGKESGSMADFDTLASQLATLRRGLVGKSLDGELGFPMQVVVLAVIAIVLGFVLHRTVLGRYWCALGHSEQAARYAGIRTESNQFMVYVLCSLLASLGGILTLLDYGSATPETVGETWELYAITGAVLGGCSLRGGEGSAIGMVLGAAVLPLLKNLISFVGSLPWVLRNFKNIDPVIPALIGMTLLIGTIADEFFRRRSK
jgi:ribose transport system permease protein